MASTVVDGERVPLVDSDVERAETDSAFARRLAEEEYQEVRDEQRRREEADRVRQAQYHHPRRIEPAHPYYYGAWRRPAVVYREPYDDWCCFCWFFWCIWLWLIIFLMLIILLPYYLEKD
jgi:hypothetical protein